MTALAKGNDPSMEEILASIRRIIADDGDGTAKPDIEPLPGVTSAPDPEPLDLAIEAEPAPKEVQGQDDIDLLFSEPAPEPPPPPPPPPAPVVKAPPLTPPPVPAMPDPPMAQLISADTSAAVAGAFASLSGSLRLGASGTLEDVVKDMLRPLLKQWLDENLPAITERLVRAEIERVARGGR